MKALQFTARGLPKGQPRPKAVHRGGFTRVYDPGTADGWKASVKAACMEIWDRRRMDGAINVNIEFYFPRPQAHYLRGEVRQTAPYHHVSKPDLDNLAKAVLDALSDLGLWEDDCRVAEMTVAKNYVSPDEVGAWVYVEEIE